MRGCRAPRSVSVTGSASVADSVAIYLHCVGSRTKLAVEARVIRPRFSRVRLFVSSDRAPRDVSGTSGCRS